MNKMNICFVTSSYQWEVVTSPDLIKMPLSLHSLTQAQTLSLYVGLQCIQNMNNNTSNNNVKQPTWNSALYVNKGFLSSSVSLLLGKEDLRNWRDIVIPMRTSQNSNVNQEEFWNMINYGRHNMKYWETKWTIKQLRCCYINYQCYLCNGLMYRKCHHA